MHLGVAPWAAEAAARQPSTGGAPAFSLGFLGGLVGFGCGAVFTIIGSGWCQHQYVAAIRSAGIDTGSRSQYWAGYQLFGAFFTFVGGIGGGGTAAETAAGLIVTPEDVSVIEQHLLRPDFTDIDVFGGRGMAPYNEAMIERLRSAAAGGTPLTGADASFYQHELYENGLMEGGMSAPAAHAQTLTDLGQTDFQLYPPDVISKYAGFFNPNYFNYWGIEP
jgi:hypothetical protein